MQLGDFGQPRVEKLARDMLARGRVAGSFLFDGAAGVGKEALAIEMGRLLNCETVGGCAPRGLFRDPPVAERHGLKLVGCLTSKVGTLNQVVHIWEYQDLADFESKRGARDADPGWAVYRSKAHNSLVRQEDKIMSGAPFSPLR